MQGTAARTHENPASRNGRRNGSRRIVLLFSARCCRRHRGCDWTTANAAEIRKHAAELGALAPDVILAHGASIVGPLLQATRTIPIVSPVAGDPVGAGFVDSLARPGGNVTGFMSVEYSMGGKWLELLKQIAPGMTRAAVLRDFTQGSGTSQFAAIRSHRRAAQCSRRFRRPRLLGNGSRVRHAGSVRTPSLGFRVPQQNASVHTDPWSSGECRFLEVSMALSINDMAPDFEAETTEGKIRFHDWISDKWAVLFSHPKDFTPVCTTELGYMARIKPEFDKRGVKIIGLSVDPVDRHAGWANDIKETQGFAPNYPMIADVDYNVSKLYGMLPAPVSGDPTKRTAADNQTVRNVFVIGPDKKVKLILVYPMTTGRNFDEVLRVIDSLQLTAKHKVATPVNWKHGEDVIIAGSVTDDDAKKTYPQGWKSPKPYIRIVPQPK